MSYTVTITDDEGVVLDSVNLDGFNLTRSDHQRLLGECIADGMGTNAVKDCAARPVPQE